MFYVSGFWWKKLGNADNATRSQTTPHFTSSHPTRIPGQHCRCERMDAYTSYRLVLLQLSRKISSFNMNSTQFYFCVVVSFVSLETFSTVHCNYHVMSHSPPLKNTNCLKSHQHACRLIKKYVFRIGSVLQVAVTGWKSNCFTTQPNRIRVVSKIETNSAASSAPNSAN